MVRSPSNPKPCLSTTKSDQNPPPPFCAPQVSTSPTFSRRHATLSPSSRPTRGRPPSGTRSSSKLVPARSNGLRLSCCATQADTDLTGSQCSSIRTGRCSSTRLDLGALSFRLFWTFKVGLGRGSERQRSSILARRGVWLSWLGCG